MSDRTYVFDGNDGGCGGGNSIWAILPALLQRQGVDPSLIALCQRGGGGNGWGDGGLFGILLLFILFGAFRNGNGFFGGNGGGGGFMPTPQGGLVPMLNNDANTAVILQSVQRNGYDISTLAQAMNTSADNVMAAINALGTQICNLGNQMGQNTNQIVMAVMQGNNGIISQLCSCCCDLKQLIAQYGSENRLAICQQTNTLQNGQRDISVAMTRGFSDIGYAFREQTCALENKMQEGFNMLREGQRNQEFREMMRENQQLRDEKAEFRMSALLQQQRTNIVNDVRPCPSPAYWVPNPFGCGCNNGYPYGNNNGCNNGCGC